MKKLLSIIFTAIIMLSLAVPAFADGGGPIYVGFDVVVTDYLGAPIYDYDYETGKMVKTLKRAAYDRKLEISGEYQFEGEVYLYFWDGEDDHGYVNKNDVRSVNETISYTEEDKLETPIKIYVFEDTYLRKGHSYMFDTVGSPIKAGTELTIKYVVGDLYETSWGFVTYNGASGWIDLCMSDDTCPTALVVDDDRRYSGSLYVAFDGVKLTERPESVRSDAEVKYVTGNIPVGTKLEFDVYSEKYDNISVYTEYNGVKGWVTCDIYYYTDELNKTAIGKEEVLFITEKSVPVYGKIADKSSKVIGHLEKGSFVTAEYYCVRLESDSETRGEIWYGVEVNGKLGWVCVEVNGDELRSAESSYYGGPIGALTSYNECTIYEYPDYSSKKLGRIPALEDILRFWYQDDFILVDYNGTVGWIDSSNINYEDYVEETEFTYDEYFSGKLTPAYIESVRTGEPMETEKATVATTVPAETQAPAKESTTVVEETATTTKAEVTLAEKAETGKVMSPSQITVICIAGALVLAATAAVSIIYIKKKKT